MFQEGRCDLVFKPIPNHSEYWISDEGIIFSLKMGFAKIHGHYVDQDGYICADLVRDSGGRRKAKVHHLVLEAFGSEPRGGRLARHLNGVPSDNRIENLAWGTSKENSRDMMLHGNATRGEKNARCKLTEYQAREIFNSDEHPIKLSTRFGVSRATVNLIKRKINWAHIHE